MLQIIKIPIIGSISESGSRLKLNYTIDVPDSLLPRSIHEYEKLFGLIVKENLIGDALLMPEDQLILMSSTKKPRPNEIFALYINGKFKLGSLHFAQDRHWFKPIAPHSKILQLEASDQVNIIGKFILVIRNVFQDEFEALTRDEIAEKRPNSFINHNHIKDALEQRTEKRIMYYVLFSLLVVIVIWISTKIVGYPYPDWTGFRAKTLWDWMELLIIPAVLTFGVILINQGQKAIDKRQIEEGERENALQTYLDKMTELLLENKLRLSNATSEEHQIARTRTITVLRRLDSERKGIIIRFLFEANLILGDDSEIAIELIGADLSRADFSNTYLGEINLNGTNLNGAIFQNTDFSDSYLQGSSLHNANLSNAILAGVDLSYADLRNANLTGTDLTGANLTGASVTRKQLKSAKSVNGAIFPIFP